MDYNIHKVCRICLEENAITSVFSNEFAMVPAHMIMLIAKIKVYKTDGLPSVICNNCIYRLGIAYNFKQECENSDIRLRQYLGILDRGYGFCDAETMTDDNVFQISNDNGKIVQIDENSDSSSLSISKRNILKIRKIKRKSRYKRKAPEEKKKRGPKPLQKVPPTCYECNKQFKCNAQLQIHLRTHSGQRPFACNFCPRRFSQKYNLQIHTRTHTHERPYQCEICSKQFSALGNFQAHQKIHTGIKDQICPVCSKAFYSAGDLAKHTYTHTGLKNYHCDVCGKAFTRNRDMVAHKKKIHLNDASSENFKCPDCHRVFATAISLSAHFRTHNTGILLHHQNVMGLSGLQNLGPSTLGSGPSIAAPTAIGPPPPSIGGISHLSPPPPHGGIGMMPPQGSLNFHPQRLHPY